MQRLYTTEEKDEVIINFKCVTMWKQLILPSL
jgi:hypothetical protein